MAKRTIKPGDQVTFRADVTHVHENGMLTVRIPGAMAPTSVRVEAVETHTPMPKFVFRGRDKPD